MGQTVQQLLAAGRIESVPADSAAAQARLGRSQQHLSTAEALRGVDNDMAYTALYDAARKAVTAHMLANGLRVPGKARAHEAVGDYAVERVPDPTGSVAEYQRMRRRRNRSEYDDAVLGVQDVAADLIHATNIVTAVAADLATDPA